MAWHPCRFWQCVENYGGQCFGGGCRLNPMPAPSEPGNTQASDTEDKDNGRHTHETIADIIAEMRRGTRLPGFWRSCDVNEILQYHADRLEAAHRREVDKLNSAIQATVSHSDAEIDRLRREIAEPRRAGNAAKLREALVQAELFVGNIVRHGHQTLVPGDKCIACDGAEELRDMICAALAAPATTEKSSAIGDAAKLREALEKCANWGEQIDCQLGSSDETVYAFRDERCLAHNISECARAALSAPPRNCDVYNNESCRMAYHLHGDGLMTMQAFADWLFAPRDGRRQQVKAQAKKRCEVCGVAFGPLSTRKRFCSQKCHDRYYAAKRRPKATCEQCGRRFQPLENTPGRFCSQKCYNTWQHEHGEGGCATNIPHT